MIFIYNELKEEIFLKKLDGFVVEGREYMVCEGEEIIIWIE